MKKLALLIPLVVIFGFGALWIALHGRNDKEPLPIGKSLAHFPSAETNREQNLQKSTNNALSADAVLPFKAAYSPLSTENERLDSLERAGCVPEGVDTLDWQLASRTSWWGQRLDPAKFWAGRVVWLDKSALSAANRRGRLYPPIPPNADVSFLKHLEDKDAPPWNGGGGENFGPRYRQAQKEGTFWDVFVKCHPRPPEQIEAQQFDVAKTILNHRHDFEHRGNPIRTTVEELTQGEESERRRASKMGYPMESFSQEALF